LWEKPDGKRTLGRPVRRYEDYFKKLVCLRTGTSVELFLRGQ